MRSTLFLFVLSFSAGILAQFGTVGDNVAVRRFPIQVPGDLKRAQPSARYKARSPQPSARYEARSPQPSARYEARSPQPSARHEARSPQPSARHELNARSPQPSLKRDAVRRDMNEQTALMDLDAFLCPFRMSACPVEPTSTLPTTLAEWSLLDYECVEFDTDLQSCGGCSSIDIRHDCSAIEDASDVACVFGECKVQTCEEGFTLSSNATSCIAN